MFGSICMSLTDFRVAFSDIYEYNPIRFTNFYN